MCDMGLDMGVKRCARQIVSVGSASNLISLLVTDLEHPTG